MNEKIDDVIKYGVYQRQELVGKFLNNGFSMSYPGGSGYVTQLRFSASQLGGAWPGWSHEASGTVTASGWAYQYRPDILPGFVEGAFYCSSCGFAGGGALPGHYGRNYSYLGVFATGPNTDDGLRFHMDWWEGTIGLTFNRNAVTPVNAIPRFSYPYTVRYRIVGNALYMMSQPGNTTGQRAPENGWVLVATNLNFGSLQGRHINAYFYGYRITNQAQYLHMYIDNYTITTYR